MKQQEKIRIREKCHRCGGHFELDNKEEKELLKKGEVFIKCPNCFKAIEVKIKKKRDWFSSSSGEGSIIKQVVVSQ